MGNRKTLSKKTRFEVFKRDKFTCQYCGKSAPDVVLEVDHVVPVAEGGDDDMLNLVTSCFDCNRGKGAIKLSDDSAVKVRKAQLDMIADRREQLDMMYKWQLGLVEETEAQIDLVSDLIGELSELTPNSLGRDDVKTWLSRFGFDVVIEATRIAFTQYRHGTPDEWSYAFEKIGGICYYRTHKTCSQCKHNVGYDSRNHLVECEFDFDGSKWCKNSYAEKCEHFESKYYWGDDDA